MQLDDAIVAFHDFDLCAETIEPETGAHSLREGEEPAPLNGDEL